MRHTPGPWRIEVIHVTEGAYTISHGMNRHGDGPEGEVGKFFGSKEDARLIAAAPELFRALDTLCSEIDFEGATPMDWASYKQALEAIKKVAKRY